MHNTPQKVRATKTPFTVYLMISLYANYLRKLIIKFRETLFSYSLVFNEGLCYWIAGQNIPSSNKIIIKTNNNKFKRICEVGLTIEEQIENMAIISWQNLLYEVCKKKVCKHSYI